jgi:hypothetical protein
MTLHLKIKKRLTMCFFALVLSWGLGCGLCGCGQTKEIERITARDTLYAVASPLIHENLPAMVTDTLVSAFRAEGKDTVVDVRYFPVERRILVKAKPDSVHIIDHDTLTQTHYVETVLETPLLSKAGLVFIGFLAAAAGAFLLKFRGIL